MANAELKGKNKLIATLKKKQTKGLTITAGFYKKAKYPDGTPIAEVAYWNNFGVASKGHFIPPRPFFSDTVREKKKIWVKLYGQLLKKHTPEQAGAIIGDLMRQDIADKILESKNGSPYKPNSPRTIAMSNNSNKEPLKDTFLMANSVGYQVKKGKPKK